MAADFMGKVCGTIRQAVRTQRGVRAAQWRANVRVAGEPDTVQQIDLCDNFGVSRLLRTTKPASRFSEVQSLASIANSSTARAGETVRVENQCS